MTQRPWGINPEQWNEELKSLFSTWLKDRGGIVVYENQMFDSSAFGSRSYVPARYYAEGSSVLHPAPQWIGDLPSERQHKVDHITLEEFDGDVERLLAECFTEEDV
jgi:hypothetical protein